MKLKLERWGSYIHIWDGHTIVGSVSLDFPFLEWRLRREVARVLHNADVINRMEQKLESGV